MSKSFLEAAGQVHVPACAVVHEAAKRAAQSHTNPVGIIDGDWGFSITGSKLEPAVYRFLVQVRAIWAMQN